jgi:hypothetical protein
MDEGGRVPQICLGKPICSSCYEDDDYEDEYGDEHPEVTLPRYSCECQHTFGCYECYVEAKLEGKGICDLCCESINLWKPCTCDECKEYYSPDPCKCGRICFRCSKNYEQSEKAEDVPLRTDKELHNFFVNTVDWTKQGGFLEELGISKTNALGQLIIHISKDPDSASQLFEILDNILDAERLEIMNENPPIGEWVSYLKKGFELPKVGSKSAIEFLIETFFLV